MGRLPVPPIVGMSGEDYVASAIVQVHAAYDFRDIKFFELVFAAGAAGNGTRAVLSADSDLEIAAWLSRHQGERISITLRGKDVLHRDGER